MSATRPAQCKRRHNRIIILSPWVLIEELDTMLSISEAMHVHCAPMPALCGVTAR